LNNYFLVEIYSVIVKPLEFKPVVTEMNLESLPKDGIVEIGYEAVPYSSYKGFP